MIYFHESQLVEQSRDTFTKLLELCQPFGNVQQSIIKTLNWTWQNKLRPKLQLMVRYANRQMFPEISKFSTTEVSFGVAYIVAATIIGHRRIVQEIALHKPKTTTLTAKLFFFY